MTSRLLRQYAFAERQKLARKQFIHEKLIGRTVRVEAFGPSPKDDTNCDIYVPLPEYGIALWIDKQ